MVAIEDLFYSATAWSKTCLFFCQMFLSLGLESGEDDSGHGLARMADWADDKIVLTLLEVALLCEVRTSDCVHSLGHFYVSQFFWHIAVRTVVVASP